MRNQIKLGLFLSTFAAAVGLFLVTAGPLRSQDRSTGSEVAVSNVMHGHIHSFALRTEDVILFISQLQTDDDAVTFDSSSAFDETIQGIQQHTHSVDLTKRDLTQLLNTGDLNVSSSTVLDHSHVFRFIRRDQCLAVASPVPSPTPSVSPSPGPSVSPSPGPSVSPSPGPTGSPSPEPTGSPSPETP